MMHLRGGRLANSSFATLLLLSPPSELPRRINPAGPSIISPRASSRRAPPHAPRGDLLMRQALEQARTAPAPINPTARIRAVGGEHVQGSCAAPHRHADAPAKLTPPANGTPRHRPRHPEQAYLRAQTS